MFRFGGGGVYIFSFVFVFAFLDHLSQDGGHRR